jgi:hypothetical protein
MYKGIDYGRGLVNIDNTTGIRYGVISQLEILQSWADSSEPIYPENPECSEEDCDDFLDPMGFEYCAEGYEANCGEDGDIFIIKSPFFTYAQFCSPCAPGACYLLNTVEEDLNNRAYCFDHSWFENGKAPYPVYSVETGKLVLPESD